MQGLDKFTPVQKLRALIQGDQNIIAPGVYDGISTLLARRVGFQVLYASGGAIARSMGYPDIGLLSMTEVCASMARIVDAAQDIPVIADADTGFGNALNVHRAMKEFERAGVAGVHIEDQAFPKRCGHLNDKSLISTSEMCHKLRVARESLSNPDFVIIARTDAIAVEGFEAAIERAQAYLEVGADMIFVEAPETLEQIQDIAKRIPQPKLINMFYGGKTPLVSNELLETWGYRITIIPSDLQRAAIHAMEMTLNVIKQHGNSSTLAAHLTSFKARELLVETEKYLQMDLLKEGIKKG